MPLCKKDDKFSYENRKGISLVSIRSKLLGGITLRRLSTTIERIRPVSIPVGVVLTDILEHRYKFITPTIYVSLGLEAKLGSVVRTVLAVFAH